MCVGFDVGCQSASIEKTETTASFCWGRCVVIKAYGLLFQRSTFLCRKSGYDLLRQAENFGTRWQVFVERKYINDGKRKKSTKQLTYASLVLATTTYHVTQWMNRRITNNTIFFLAKFDFIHLHSILSQWKKYSRTTFIIERFIQYF